MRKLVLLLLLWPAFAFADSARSPDELRQICSDAMNADPSFAQAIVKTISEQTANQHARAADDIARNERHVILAYAAMWVVAALFLIFLWRRQMALRGELARLQRDLETAMKESPR